MSCEEENLPSFHVIRELGVGTYGYVSLAVNSVSKEEVAVKEVKLDKLKPVDFRGILRECRILKTLRHRHLVSILDVFKTPTELIIVMEYVSNGELFELVEKQSPLTEAIVRKIFGQISSTVYFLHLCGIVHRDLKLENIFLTSNNDIKIGDFGFANFIERKCEFNSYQSKKLLRTSCGSPLYSSPEIVQGLAYRGPEVDVWSMGVILFCLQNGHMPFTSCDNSIASLKKKIVNGDYHLPDKSSECSKIIIKALTVDSIERITSKQLCESEWLNNNKSEDNLETHTRREAEDLLRTNDLSCLESLDNNSAFVTDVSTSLSIKKYEAENAGPKIKLDLHSLKSKKGGLNLTKKLKFTNMSNFKFKANGGKLKKFDFKTDKASEQKCSGEGDDARITSEETPKNVQSDLKEKSAISVAKETALHPLEPQINKNIIVKRNPSNEFDPSIHGNEIISSDSPVPAELNTVADDTSRDVTHKKVVVLDLGETISDKPSDPMKPKVVDFTKDSSSDSDIPMQNLTQMIVLKEAGQVPSPRQIIEVTEHGETHIQQMDKSKLDLVLNEDERVITWNNEKTGLPEAIVFQPSRRASSSIDTPGSPISPLNDRKSPFVKEGVNKLPFSSDGDSSSRDNEINPELKTGSLIELSTDQQKLVILKWPTTSDLSTGVFGDDDEATENKAIVDRSRRTRSRRIKGILKTPNAGSRSTSHSRPDSPETQVKSVRPPKSILKKRSKSGSEGDSISGGYVSFEHSDGTSSPVLKSILRNRPRSKSSDFNLKQKPLKSILKKDSSCAASSRSMSPNSVRSPERVENFDPADIYDSCEKPLKSILKKRSQSIGCYDMDSTIVDFHLSPNQIASVSRQRSYSVDLPTILKDFASKPKKGILKHTKDLRFNDFVKIKYGSELEWEKKVSQGDNFINESHVSEVKNKAEEECSKLKTKSDDEVVYGDNGNYQAGTYQKICGDNSDSSDMEYISLETSDDEGEDAPDELFTRNMNFPNPSYTKPDRASVSSELSEAVRKLSLTANERNNSHVPATTHNVSPCQSTDEIEPSGNITFDHYRRRSAMVNHDISSVPANCTFFPSDPLKINYSETIKPSDECHRPTFPQSNYFDSSCSRESCSSDMIRQRSAMSHQERVNCNQGELGRHFHGPENFPRIGKLSQEEFPSTFTDQDANYLSSSSCDENILSTPPRNRNAKLKQVNFHHQQFNETLEDDSDGPTCPEHWIQLFERALRFDKILFPEEYNPPAAERASGEG